MYVCVYEWQFSPILREILLYPEELKGVTKKKKKVCVCI